MKNKRGITLVALVITIIILLILAGITISQLTENGLITKIIEAKEKQKNSEEYENNIINQYIQDIENINQPDVDVNDPSFIKYGLIQKISKISKSGYSNLEIEGTINEVVEKINYNIHIIVYNGNLVLDGTNTIPGATLHDNIYEFGDNTKDVGTENQDAQYMVVLKVYGNLTINPGVTLTSCKSEENYGGPKGMTIYCTGTLTNNGIISMTERGAKAEGENVYLWNNEKYNTDSNGTGGEFEYIPKLGSNGAISYETNTSTYQYVDPSILNAEGVGRKTAGGASGGAGKIGVNIRSKGGTGGQGTSYSGGGGGGGTATRDIYMEPDNGKLYLGGNGVITTEGGYKGTAYSGRSYGGGLLIIYANNIKVSAEGLFESCGQIVNGSSYSNKNDGIYQSGGSGGGSGGGSINIFYLNSIEGVTDSNFKVTADSYSPKGTYNIGCIGTGSYVSYLSTN